MTWTSFLLTLALSYFAYYGLNILFDLMIARRPEREGSKDTILFFEEPSEPELIVEELEVKNISEDVGGTDDAPAVLSSGEVHAPSAVSLKELFNLAKDNLIEYTRAIPY